MQCAGMEDYAVKDACSVTPTQVKKNIFLKKVSQNIGWSVQNQGNENNHNEVVDEPISIVYIKLPKSHLYSLQYKQQNNCAYFKSWMVK